MSLAIVTNREPIYAYDYKVSKRYYYTKSYDFRTKHSNIRTVVLSYTALAFIAVTLAIIYFLIKSDIDVAA
jgi:hypothetical protein